MIVQEELSRTAAELGKHFTITLEHTERVKWYAPHIRHVVLDIQCSAMSASASRPHQPKAATSQVSGGSQPRILAHSFMHSPGKVPEGLHNQIYHCTLAVACLL